MELFVEFKFDANVDPFIDSEGHIPNPHFERDTEAACVLRCGLDWIPVLDPCVHHSYMRPLSRSFDYTSTEYLDIFLQQFDKNVDRGGHDPSVTIPEPSLLRKMPMDHQA